MRQFIASFRLKYHSRSRVKKYIEFLSELIGDLPSNDLAKDECESAWAISTS